MKDLTLASLRAHGNNISRYRTLLGTNLTELERQFIVSRLNEEAAAMENLSSTQNTIRLGQASEKYEGGEDIGV